jgi:hypothetical protein
LFKWELAEVAMVEGVLGGEQTGSETKVRTVERRSGCHSNALFVSHSWLSKMLFLK